MGGVKICRYGQEYGECFEMFVIPEKVARYTMICVRTIWRFLYIDDLKLSIQTCRLRKTEFCKQRVF